MEELNGDVLGMGGEPTEDRLSRRGGSNPVAIQSSLWT